jgi:polar amino acid transport system permease protein
LWIGVYFLILFGIALGLYYATRQIDYVWRWYRIPQYFVHEDEIEIYAGLNGDVAEITLRGDNAVVTIQGGGETQRLTVPARGIRLQEGDLVSVGDVVGVKRQWKAGILLQGLWITLQISIIAILVGVVLGLFTGLARISRNPALKWSAVTYIELIRGSPLLVQIFIWYFVLGTLINTLLSQHGFRQLSSFWFGAAALAFFTGAYVAEMVRAGIQSIHRGQTEASRSLGMTYTQTMTHVVMPQALRRILPPLAGQFISLIKDSSLLGIIAIRELTKATREIVSTSLQPFELWFLCAILYLLLTFSLSMLVQYLERRTVL